MARILVIEDNIAQAQILQMILETEGLRTEIASTAERALERFFQSRFDVVISDVVLPSQSGYDLCQQIKSHPQGQLTAVILLTSLSDPLDMVRGLACGADHFITKPYQAHQILEHIQQCLQQQEQKTKDSQRSSVVEFTLMGQKFEVSADKNQIFDQIGDVFQKVLHENKELQQSQQRLADAKAEVEQRAKRLESLAESSSEKYRLLMENANDAIFLLQTDGVIVEVNRQAEELLAEKSNAILSRPISDFVLPSERDYIAIQLRKILQEKSLRIHELQMSPSHGEPVIVDMSAALVTTGNNSFILTTIRDVSTRNRLERQAVQSEKLATIGTLAAGIAHEINNPIAYVLGNVTYLKRLYQKFSTSFGQLRDFARSLPGEHRERLNTLLGQLALEDTLPDLQEIAQDSIEGCERIRTIVQDLRTFARIDEEDIAQVQINQILESALSMSLHEIRFRTQVEKNLAPNLPDIFASPHRLSQLFLQLIVNAAHAMDESTLSKNVLHIESKQEGEHIRIDISDTGKGIAPNLLTHIFDPFFTTKPVGIGTGLGLFICQDIVQKHGGNLQVKSELGKGTTFTVFLPRQTGQESSAPKRPISGLTPNKRLNLLLIDDEPHLLKSYQRLLEPYHNVTSASSGRIAIALLAQPQSFDVVISDLIMPDIDGVDLYQYLEDQHPMLAYRVIFITGAPLSNKTKQFIEQTAIPVLHKPFDIEVFLKTIAELVAYEPPI